MVNDSLHYCIKSLNYYKLLLPKLKMVDDLLHYCIKSLYIKSLYIKNFYMLLKKCCPECHRSL